MGRGGECSGRRTFISSAHVSRSADGVWWVSILSLFSSLGTCHTPDRSAIVPPISTCAPVPLITPLSLHRKRACWLALSFLTTNTHVEQPAWVTDEDSLVAYRPRGASGRPHHCVARAFSARVCVDVVFSWPPYRGVDLVTALATPLTYEGLIDDLIGIENG